MRGIAGFSVLVVFLAAAACGAGPAPEPGAEDPGTVREAPPPDEGSLPSADTVVTDAGDGWSIVFRYPPEVLEIGALADSLAGHSRTVAAPFRAMLAERSPGDMDWSFEASYTVEPSPEGLLCILAWMVEYSGGPHGSAWTASA